MKHKCSKLGIALVCLTSSIHFDSSYQEEYLEDSTMFEQIAEGLKSGWHWGCSSVSATERIEVKGKRPPPYRPPNWGGAGSPGGGGGYDETEYETTSDSDPAEIAEAKRKACERSINVKVASCKDTYTTYTTAAGTFCVRLSGGFAKTFCTGVAASSIARAINWCELQGEKLKDKQCK